MEFNTNDFPYDFYNNQKDMLVPVNEAVYISEIMKNEEMKKIFCNQRAKESLIQAINDAILRGHDYIDFMFYTISSDFIFQILEDNGYKYKIKYTVGNVTEIRIWWREENKNENDNYER